MTSAQSSRYPERASLAPATMMDFAHTFTQMIARITQRPVVAVMVLCAIITLSPPNAWAQRLNLDDPEPPRTTSSSYSMTRANQLEREAGRADGFDAAAVPGTPDTEVLTQSRNAWRMIAAALLRMPAPEDSMAVVMGHTLADGGASIDSALAQLESASNGLAGDARRDCFDALIRFLERADLPLASPDAGPQRLASARRALEPLLEAVAIIEEATPISAWPSATGASINAARDVDATVAMIDGWVDAPCPPPVDVATALRRQVQRVDRSVGDRGAVRPGSVGVLSTGLSVLLDYGRAISRASWLRKDEQDRLHWDALGVALDRLTDATALDEVVDMLTRIELTVACFNLLEEMASTRVPSSMRFRLQSVYEFMLRIDPTRDIPGQAWRLDQLRQGLILAMDARRLPPVEERVDMRRVAKEIQVDYLRAEALLLVTLSDPSFDPIAARGDPDYVSLAARVRRELEDLRRVRTANHWIDQMAERDRNLQRELKKALLDLRAQLKDFLVADDVSARLEMLEQDVARFIELPQEAALTQPGSLVRQIASEHAQAMSTRIAVARRAWINAWAHGGDIDETTRDMDDLYRWAVALDACAQLRTMLDEDREGFAATSLNAWAGWQCEPESLRRDLVGLERAVNNAARVFGEDSSRGRSRLIDQLEQRAAPALLTGDLLREQTRFQSLPRNATGTLSQVVFPPTRGSWQAAHADRFARYVRYRRELDDLARRDRRGPDALRAYVWFEASLLLDETGRSYRHP